MRGAVIAASLPRNHIGLSFSGSCLIKNTSPIVINVAQESDGTYPEMPRHYRPSPVWSPEATSSFISPRAQS